MSEYHFPIPGGVDEKDIVIFVRRHWASFLSQIALSFLLIIIPIVALILLHAYSPSFFRGLILNILVLFLSIYYLVVITFVFVAWLSFYFNIYIITRTAIIDVTQVGFFGRQISQLSLLRIQDVTSSIEGFLPTIFSYGTVLVETAGEKSQNYLICNVPNPQEISSSIVSLHDEIIKSENRQDQIREGEGVLSKEVTPLQDNAVLEAKKPEGETILNPPLKTPYQELLDKDKKNEGEVSEEDLNKGGDINLK